MKRLFLLLTVTFLFTLTWSAQASQLAPIVSNSPAQEAAQWTRIDTGGETACADGSPFSFWVHEGTSDRLTFYFNGGGACWNGIMCGLGGNPETQGISVYTNQVVDVFTVEQAGGMFDLENPENPFKDDTIVGVPYCTGDVFSGTQVVTYETPTGPLEIHHTGLTNALAVLDWVSENYPDPSSVVATGCSGGSAGLFSVGPHIMEQYNSVPVYQLNDSLVGVSNGPLLAFDAWGTYDNLPNYIPEVEAMRGDFQTAAYLQAVADYYPENRFAHFSYAFDNVQSLFYGLLPLTPEEWKGALTLIETQGMLDELEPAWSEAMFAVFDQIDAPNFRGFVAPSDEHCMLYNERFYSTESNGVRLIDWISDFVTGADVESVFCTDCAIPEATE